MENEYVAELLANKKGMKDMQKEMKKIMGNVKDTEVAETEEDDDEEIENDDQEVDENEDDNENESMDSDIKLAAYDK
jgi:hypothetical protein